MARRRARKKNTQLHESIAREIWAIIFLFLGIFLFLSLFNNLGALGQWINLFLVELFGKGVWLFPVALFATAISLFFSKKFEWSLFSVLGIFFLFFSIQGVIHTSSVEMGSGQDITEGGGMFGVAASILFRAILGDTGTYVLLSGVFLIGFLLTFQISLLQLFSAVLQGVSTFFAHVFGGVSSGKNDKKSEERKNKKGKTPEKNDQNAQGLKNTKDEKQNTEKLSSVQQDIFEINRGKQLKKEQEEKQKNSGNISEKTKVQEPVRPEDQDFSAWEKPSIDLLEVGSSVVHIPDSELHEMGRKIVEKLNNFKIGTRMRSAFVGPTVTQFALEPDATVKLSKITGLKSELALALSAESVRIEAPIPGKNLVGIEIPNPKRSTVLLKEIMESDEYKKTDGALRLALGKDVSGSPMVENLEEMPHLLIAGATGSGKSVGMNTFLVSMLFENSPADLRFIMVDPKRVELMPYEGIPHLLTPVITDAGKALSALRWSVAEMMRRLDEFSKVGARNIAEFNERVEEKIRQREEEEKNMKLSEEEKKENARKNPLPKKVPRIVIVIDELADLMMREHKKETEAMICRIAQMARAVGMHLIIATQRPSVDVITGLIKANIPTRIAFSVTSSIDSRTVIDSVGAEDLLGRGDMLFTNPKSSRPKRIQGIYLSGKEIEKVVRHLKINISDEDFFSDHISLDEETDEMGNVKDEFGAGYGEMGNNSGESGGDALLEQAIELVRESKKASASLLQRRLSVGYARAARILDEMEEKGMIGPSKGAKPRDIFL
jgi:S-DNA-T family DNA segregation ATPase FtsK/SpoIIIE